MDTPSRCVARFLLHHPPKLWFSQSEWVRCQSVSLPSTDAPCRTTVSSPRNLWFSLISDWVTISHLWPATTHNPQWSMALSAVLCETWAYAHAFSTQLPLRMGDIVQIHSDSQGGSTSAKVSSATSSKRSLFGHEDLNGMCLERSDGSFGQRSRSSIGFSSSNGAGFWQS